MTFKCYGCKEDKPQEDFYPAKGRGERRPISGKCKQCISAIRKAKLLNDPAYKEREKARQKRFEENNPGRQYELTRRWKKENPDKNRAQNNRVRSRRDALIRGANRVEAIGLEDVYLRDNGICKLCGHPCDREHASIDHRLPLSKGGDHIWDNVQLAHRKCNSEKGSMTC